MRIVRVDREAIATTTKNGANGEPEREWRFPLPTGIPETPETLY